MWREVTLILRKGLSRKTTEGSDSEVNNVETAELELGSGNRKVVLVKTKWGQLRWRLEEMGGRRNRRL